MNRWTVDRVAKEFENLSDRSNYTLLNCIIEKNSVDRLVVECNTCGNIFDTTVGNFLNQSHSHRCSICKRGERWSINRIRKLMSENGQDTKFTLDTSLGDVTTAYSKIVIICNDCGYQHLTNCRFVEKNKCCTCESNNQTWTFCRVINLLRENNTSLVSYTRNIQYNKETKITYKCNICNHINTVSLYLLTQSAMICRHCSGALQWSRDRVIFDFNNLSDKDSYTLIQDEALDNVSGYLSKFNVQCNKENHIWEVTPDSFFGIRQTRCPFCSQSKGERNIEDFLNKNNIQFEREKRFATCRNKRELPFDFFLPEINCVIEAHGEQHYDAIDYFGGTTKFIKTKYHDELKQQWCLQNGIIHIVVPYTSYDSVDNALHVLSYIK